MKKNQVLENPYLLFLPFLIAFLIYIIINPTNGTSGDEARYLSYANNLMNGYYSPPGLVMYR
jgi:hypothetical protein